MSKRLLYQDKGLPKVISVEKCGESMRRLLPGGPVQRRGCFPSSRIRTEWHVDELLRLSTDQRMEFDERFFSILEDTGIELLIRRPSLVKDGWILKGFPEFNRQG